MNPGKALASTRTTRTVGVGFSMKFFKVDHKLTINSNKKVIRLKINTSSFASKQIYMSLFMHLHLISVRKMPRGNEVGLGFKTSNFFI